MLWHQRQARATCGPIAARYCCRRDRSHCGKHALIPYHRLDCRKGSFEPRGHGLTALTSVGPDGIEERSRRHTGFVIDGCSDFTLWVENNSPLPIQWPELERYP